MSKQVTIEVVDGVEGPCLYVSNPAEGIGTRISGPKPWGGGTTIASFKVDLDELIAEANELAVESP